MTQMWSEGERGRYLTTLDLVGHTFVLKAMGRN